MIVVVGSENETGGESSSLGWEPSGAIVQSSSIWSRPVVLVELGTSRLRSKAILVPSGDHAGWPSLPCVKRRTALVLTVSTKMPSSPSYTIFDPSGDQLGWLSCPASRVNR